jgi:hypothetical protein
VNPTPGRGVFSAPPDRTFPCGGQRSGVRIVERGGISEPDLSVGQRIPIPDGPRTVQVHDPETSTRTRVDLGRARRQRRA